MMVGKELPKYCSRFGKKGHIYFRYKGDLTRMPGAANTEAFKAEYERLMDMVRRGNDSSGVATIMGDDLHQALRGLEKAARRRSKKYTRVYSLPNGWAADTYANQLGLCAISGLMMRTPIKAWDPHGPSIDRIDSSFGYTPENCQLTAFGINRAKNNMSYNDLVEFCQAVVRNHKRTNRKRNMNLQTWCKM